MPTRESALQRATRRTTFLLRRAGDELRIARMEAGWSTRRLGSMVGISHTQVRRIEAGLARAVGLDVLARMASVLGFELSLGIHPIGSPIRDAGQSALLGRFRGRLPAAAIWRLEVGSSIPGDLRSADATVEVGDVRAVVEAETRINDVQAVIRRLRGKQRDLGISRAILLVADTRHNREVIDSAPGLMEEFPVGTRACLAALARGVDPGGDCLVIL